MSFLISRCRFTVKTHFGGTCSYWLVLLTTCVYVYRVWWMDRWFYWRSYMCGQRQCDSTKPDAWRKMIGDVFIEELQNLGHCTSDIFYYSAISLPEVLAWRCTFWTNERNCVFTALTEFWFVNTSDGCRQRLFASSGMKRRILSVAPCNVWET